MAKKSGLVARLNAHVSTILHRADLGNRAGLTFEGRRDLYQELGYKRVLDYDDYHDRYVRGGIASRVVDAYPTATWRNPPVISVKDNDKFNDAWKSLVNRLAVFHYLERVDKVAGIGRYAALFLGVSGGRGVGSTIPKVKGPDGVLFLSIFSQVNADIIRLEGDPQSPRFGLPSSYNVRFLSGFGVQSRSTTQPVHSSRIIHIAENTLEDDIFGIARMTKVWNYLDDLDKTVGGSAEALWRTVDRGLQFDIDPELNLNPDDEEAFSDEIEEYFLGLKRYIKTKGITITPLGSDVPDPRGAAETIVSLIAGTTGIPNRILLGSERGEMSSSQDERNFNSRVRERQLSFAEPVILRPLINRLISINALPEPNGDIIIEWPDLTITSDKEAADIAARTGQAIKHVSDQKILTVPPKLFATKYLGIDEDEYDAAVAALDTINLQPSNTNTNDKEDEEKEDEDDE
jgi:hypothetical protein